MRNEKSADSGTLECGGCPAAGGDGSLPFRQTATAASPPPTPLWIPAERANGGDADCGTRRMEWDERRQQAPPSPPLTSLPAAPRIATGSAATEGQRMPTARTTRRHFLQSAAAATLDGRTFAPSSAATKAPPPRLALQPMARQSLGPHPSLQAPPLRLPLRPRCRPRRKAPHPARPIRGRRADRSRDARGGPRWAEEAMQLGHSSGLRATHP